MERWAVNDELKTKKKKKCWERSCRDLLEKLRRNYPQDYGQGM
jgi:hypothetical protein